MNAAAPAPYRNPDHALLHGYHGPLPRTLDTNPLMCALGGQMLAIDRVRGTLRLGFTPTGPVMVGPDGVLTRFAALAMIDFTLGLVALSQVAPPHSIATVSLDVAALSSLGVGPWWIDAQIEQRQGGLFHSRAVLYSGDGAEVMSGSSILLQTG